MAGEVYTLPCGIKPSELENLSNDLVEKVERTAPLVTPDFKIDPEFRGLMPPLDPGAMEDLKKSIQKEGCRDRPVISKIDGEYVLLDGHKRHDICNDLGISFEVREIAISDCNEAKIWIIKNQKARRNLNESQRSMLAVTLEELYAEQAKNRTSGLNLEHTYEPGRSSEKAARDMGVSHQSVSYAKQVSTKGIPELARLASSGDVAVSALAKVTSLPAESQVKVVEKVEAQIKEGRHPNIAAIITEIAPREEKDDPDERLERLRKGLETSQKLVRRINKTKRPENLIELKQMAEEILQLAKEIENKSLDPTLKSKDIGVVEVKLFRRFIESIQPISKKVTLRFDHDGVRAKATNPSTKTKVEAFIPRSSFSPYVELGEIGLDMDVMANSLKAFAGSTIPGKKNLGFHIEKGTDGKLDQLNMTSGVAGTGQSVLNPVITEELEYPEPISTTCKIRIEGKELAEAIKDHLGMLNTKNKSSKLNKFSRLLASERFFRIACEDELSGRGTMKVKCEEFLENGTADSTFEKAQLKAIMSTIGRSQEVILSLGMDQPMILDLDIDGILIKYLIVQSDTEVKPQEASRGQEANEPPATTKEPLDNREKIGENSPDSSSSYDYADMPDGWGEYEAAMKIENATDL